MPRTRFAPCLVCLLLLVGCRTVAPPPQQGQVEHVITTLASDEMGGRYAYGPEARHTARFIAGEFERTGLGLLDMETWRAHRRADNTLLVVDAGHQATFDRLAGFLNRPVRTTEPGGGANLVMVLAEETDVQDFTVEAASRRSEATIANVAGVLPGNRTDEVVLFSAHYDHLARRDVTEGDAIFNGANDNASGTTAVIELARHFKALDLVHLKNTIAAIAAGAATIISGERTPTRIDPATVN